MECLTERKLIRHPTELLEHASATIERSEHLAVLGVDCRYNGGFLLSLTHRLQHVVGIEFIRHVPQRYVVACAEARLHQIRFLVCEFIEHYVKGLECPLLFAYLRRDSALRSVQLLSLTIPQTIMFVYVLR